MLQIPENRRLEYINRVLDENFVDRKNTHLVEITGEDKGNISKMLNNKLPISNKFLQLFQQKYPKPPKGWEEENEVLRRGDFHPTLKDYFDEIRGDRDFLRMIMKTSLVDISTNLSELLKKNEGSRAIPAAQNGHSDQIPVARFVSDEGNPLAQSKPKGASRTGRQGRKSGKGR
jgi:hypothetical protein